MVDRIAAGTLSGLMTANAWPLVVRSHEAKVTKDGGRLLVLVEGEPPVAMRLAEISQLVVMGGATVTTPAVHALLRQGTPICWHGRDGWFLGMTQGLPASGAAARIAQYRAAEDPDRAVALARALVSAKIRNARARLRDRRGWRPGMAAAVCQLGGLDRRAPAAATMETLRGIEGAAAAIYFDAFAALPRPPRPEDRPCFAFAGRRRRPPPDAVNAMLSFAYALLVRGMTVAIAAAGLDPMVGFLHGLASGRPALALDLMEAFRPPLADAVVVGLINRGEVGRGDFAPTDDGGIALADEARRKLVQGFEARLDEQVTLDWLGRPTSWRRLIALQPRLLVQCLMEERDALPVPVPR